MEESEAKKLRKKERVKEKRESVRLLLKFVDCFTR